MSYRTDMVESILKSEEGRTILEYLSPIYGESYVALWMLQVIGMQLDKVSDWSAQAALQVTPQTATWTLDFWEAEYSLVPNPNWTIEQRRQNILANMKFVAPVNPAKLKDILEGVAGCPVDLIENTAKNTFTVTLRQYTDAFLRVKETLDRAKPAHLIYVLQMAILITANANLYTGAAVATKETYKVKVVQ